MGTDVPASGQADGGDDVPGLPEHLASMVGSLQGPADLGRNHDKYLSYADRDQADIPDTRTPGRLQEVRAGACWAAADAGGVVGSSLGPPEHVAQDPGNLAFGRSYG
jgi:hypothetical protein